MDVDEMILAMADTEVERRPLNGIDVWRVQTADEVRAATTVARSAQFHRVREEQGVESTCEQCGKVKRVHPANAVYSYFCTVNCRMKAEYRIKVLGHERRHPLRPRKNGEA